MSDKKSFYVARWYVEPDKCQISDQGENVKLESKVMDLLVYFAEHPGEVLSREDIEQHIWGDTIVGYDALTASIAKLRKALGDNSRKPAFVVTISKKGYQLIAPVRQSEEYVSNSPVVIEQSRTVTWKLPGLLLSVVLTAGIFVSGLMMAFKSDATAYLNNDIETNQLPSIAVLPFEEISQGTEENLFGEGITEDITSAIASLSGVNVIARSSVMAFKNTEENLKQIALKLGVRYLLEGSVRRDAANLRVNVRLIDGESGFQLWAKNYNDKVKEIFSIQENIIQEMINHLAIKISAQEQQRLAAKYTTSPEAYELFLQGQHYFAYHNHESNEQARTLFFRATELDPYFARAFGALALTYVDEFRYQWHSSQTDDADLKQQAMKYANKALDIDPQLAQAYWVQANVNLFDKSHAQAIQAAEKAITLVPNYADAYATLAVSHIYLGKPETAIPLMKKAMQLNPENPARYRSALGQAYYYLGEYNDAESVLRNAIERNSALTPARIFLIATLNKLQKTEELNWELIQLETAFPHLDLDGINAMFPFADQTMAKAVYDSLHVNLAGS